MKHFYYSSITLTAGAQCKQKGQIILILIMVMTVALGIGLSIVQKSLVDLSTASKVEQSSRAFSAAEAGIEKALQEQASGNITNTPGLSLDNLSRFDEVVNRGLIPAVAEPNSRQAPLEYPPLAKEDIVQVWLADLNSLTNPPATFYTQDNLDIYWGNSDTDKAALELTLVYYGTDSTDPIDPSTPKYRSRKWYLDNVSAGRSNGFEKLSCSGSYSLENYQCFKKLGDSNGINNGPLPSGLMLIRARLLYNTSSQPFAVQAIGTCNPGCSLPPQAREIISTGVAGETKRKVKVFQMNKVVPPFFDYAIFSVGPIEKP